MKRLKRLAKTVFKLLRSNLRASWNGLKNLKKRKMEILRSYYMKHLREDQQGRKENLFLHILKLYGIILLVLMVKVMLI